MFQHSRIWSIDYAHESTCTHPGFKVATSSRDLLWCADRRRLSACVMSSLFGGNHYLFGAGDCMRGPGNDPACAGMGGALLSVLFAELPGLMCVAKYSNARAAWKAPQPQKPAEYSPSRRPQHHTFLKDSDITPSQMTRCATLAPEACYQLSKVCQVLHELDQNVAETW
jgi:hypothetical protein